MSISPRQYPAKTRNKRNRKAQKLARERMLKTKESYAASFAQVRSDGIGVEPSPDLLAKVRRAVEAARAAATTASQSFLRSAPRSRDGHVADVCGGARIVMADDSS